MAWDKKHYKEIYEHVQAIFKLGWSPEVFLPVVRGCIEAGDFEAAQATSDAIRKWFEDHSVSIPPDATLKLPDTYEEPRGYHLSLGVPDDFSGMASGGAIWG